MNEEICKDIIKGNLDIYKTNLRFLSSKKKYIIRIPVIGGYTDDAENRRLVIKEIERHKDSIIRIELIKEHDLGNSKYKSLSLPVPNYSGIDDEFIVKYKKEIEAAVDIPIEFVRFNYKCKLYYIYRKVFQHIRSWKEILFNKFFMKVIRLTLIV